MKSQTISRVSTPIFIAAVFALALVGCGGEDILGAAAYAGPTSIDIVRGENKEIALDLGRQVEEVEGDTVRQSVTGLPSGVTIAYNSQDITIGNPDLKRTYATLTATSLANLGSYSLLFSRTGTSDPAEFSSTIRVRNFGSTVSTPSSFTLLADSTTTLVATVTVRGGSTGTVTLSASNLPSGVTATFTPATLAFTTVGSSKTSQVVFTCVGAAPAAFKTQIIATNGSESDSSADISVN